MCSTCVVAVAQRILRRRVEPLARVLDVGVEAVERLAGVVPVDVAERHDVLRCEVDQVRAPLTADADAGDVQRVARRRQPAAEDVARHDRETRARRGDLANEAAAGHGRRSNRADVLVVFGHVRLQSEGL
jgi:hypothetical protein